MPHQSAKAERGRGNGFALEKEREGRYGAGRGAEAWHL